MTQQAIKSCSTLWWSKVTHKIIIALLLPNSIWSHWYKWCNALLLYRNYFRANSKAVLRPRSQQSTPHFPHQIFQRPRRRRQRQRHLPTKTTRKSTTTTTAATVKKRRTRCRRTRENKVFTGLPFSNCHKNHRRR